MELAKKRKLATNAFPVYFLYDLAVRLAALLLPIPALFNPKLRSFVKGRREVYDYLDSFRDPSRELVWMHAASLGEFEQGLPVLESLQLAYPGKQFLVTFFSPSGYEVKKGRIPGTGTCYLPLDTKTNARKFTRMLRPEIALFVKYEVWPGYFRELARLDIPLVMISAAFRRRQAYFRPYGGFLRKALHNVNQFYVQDGESGQLLESLGITNISISGDTRMDRVSEIRGRDNHLAFMEEFKRGRTCMVLGSTWPEDYRVALPLVNAMAGPEFCFVIAPHRIDTGSVSELIKGLEASAVLYSQLSETAPEAGIQPWQYNILVVNTIGLLTKIYSYADLAYVGGGFATGLHNTLEPAVFGIPVLIGPKFQGFREAEDLVDAGGYRVVEGPESFEAVTRGLLQDPVQRRKAGQINAAYIMENKGASTLITRGILKILG